MRSDLKGIKQLQMLAQAGEAARIAAGQPRAGLPALIGMLEKVRARARRRLATTVEEEASTRAHFEEVCRREERAGKERASLEQQLRLEQRERAKQTALIEAHERRSREELEAVQQHADARRAALEEGARSQRAADEAAYNEAQITLTKEVEKLKVELADLQKQNREDEAAMMKKKGKSEQEVSNWLGEYDRDMGTREKAYREEKVVYEEVKQQLRSYEEEYGKLRAEAEEAAAKEAARHAAEEAKLLEEKKMDEAASAIQNMWKSHKKEVEAAKAPAKKGKGGKKKK